MPLQRKQHSRTHTHKIWDTRTLNRQIMFREKSKLSFPLKKYERKVPFVAFFRIFILSCPKRTRYGCIVRLVTVMRRFTGTVFELNVPRCWHPSAIGLEWKTDVTVLCPLYRTVGLSDTYQQNIYMYMSFPFKQSLRDMIQASISTLKCEFKFWLFLPIRFAVLAHELQQQRPRADRHST